MVVLTAIVVVSGCGGGGKKRSKDRQGQPVGVIAGSVDLFNGFGVDAGLTERSRVFSDEELVARAYLVHADGSGIAPMTDVPAQPVAGGVFRLGKVPLGDRNVIVRIEKAGGEPVLSAVAPFIGPQDNFLTVSPETDIETSIFLELVKLGLKNPGDIDPGNADISFIKEIVTELIFFDLEKTPDTGAVTAALTPIVRDAYTRYVEALAGGDAQAGDPAVVALNDLLAGPLAKVLIADESGNNRPNEGDEVELRETLSKAVAEAGLAAGRMSPQAIWETARHLSLMRAAKCAGSNLPDCPTKTENSDFLTMYGPALERRLSAEGNGWDLKSRALRLFPSSVATGTTWLPPVDVVRKLTGLDSRLIEPFRTAISGQGSREKREQQESTNKKLALGNLRDMLVVGVTGMDQENAEKMYLAIYRESRPLAGLLEKPDFSMKQIQDAHEQFLNMYDPVFQPLRSSLRSRYSKLEETDIKKLTWAMYEIVLNSTLFDIPSSMFLSLDTDGDGVPDNAERFLGTEASDSASGPAEVLTEMPSSMLPPPPRDTDNDGFPDIVEKMAGSDPEDMSSRPLPGKTSFCKNASPVCPAASGGAAVAAAPKSLTGKTEYEGSPVNGLTVGIYKTPDFFDRMPDQVASEKTGAGGTFTVSPPAPGSYFVVAFNDTDGDSKPGNGEAAGYYGETYPRRVTIGDSSEGLLVVEMKGIIGKARCEEGQVYNRMSGECADKCPEGFEKDGLTRECACPEGRIFIETEGVCGTECPEGTVADPVREGCFCPEGTKVDRDTATCICPEDMFLDTASAICRCRRGFLHRQSMTCVDECPESFIADADSGSCACPEGASYTEGLGRCVCGRGFMSPRANICLDACPAGMLPDKEGNNCVCPENEMYDGEQDMCVCKPGMERLAQGTCGNPGVPRPSEETRERMKQKRPGDQRKDRPMAPWEMPGSTPATGTQQQELETTEPITPEEMAPAEDSQGGLETPVSGEKAETSGSDESSQSDDQSIEEIHDESEMQPESPINDETDGSRLNDDF